MIIEKFIIFFLFYWWVLALLEKWQIRYMLKEDLRDLGPKDFWNFNPFIWIVLFVFIASTGFCYYCDYVMILLQCFGLLLAILAIKWVLTRNKVVDILYDAVDCEFCFESHTSLLLAAPIALYYWNPMYLLFAWSAKALRMIIKEFKKE
jgi:hypothetical protein